MNIVPGRWLYTPPTYLAPLELGTVFPESRPLEVELGAGDGSFLVDWARAHPERNLLGIERLLGRLRKIDRKAQRQGLENVRGLRVEAGYFLEWMLPPGAAAAIHVYFPDPWPKRKQRRKRLVNERFVELAHRALAAGGRVYLRTDDADYFAQMTAVFGASVLFHGVETPPDLAAAATDFERDFAARGVAARRAAYERY